MTSQYVFPSSRGLFRIVRHGHRWRALIEAQELGRHDSAEAALDALRLAWPQAKLPLHLDRWRQLAEPYALPHARLAHTSAGSRPIASDPASGHVRRSRRTASRPSRGVTDHG